MTNIKSRVSVALSDTLLELTDKLRGDVSRSKYLHMALEDYLHAAAGKIMPQRDVEIKRSTEMFTYVKLPDPKLLVDYVVDKLSEEHEYSCGNICCEVCERQGGQVLSRRGMTYDVISERSILRKIHEPISIFNDAEVCWLQRHLVDDLDLCIYDGCQDSEFGRDVEYHLDLLIKERGKLLYHVESDGESYVWIKPKLQSLGLDPKVYERECRRARDLMLESK